MNKKVVILALHLGVGGAEKVICNLANLLSEHNDVKIISTYKLDNSPAFHLAENIKIEYLIKNLKPNKQELKNAVKNFNIFLTLKEVIRSLKILYLRKSLMIEAIKTLDCDIIISTRTLHNRWVSRFANNKIIKIAQEHNHHNNNEKYIKKLINSLKGFNYFMPVSKELAEFYKNKVGNTNVLYIPNFIENIPIQKSTLQNKQLISVGRLDKIKGFNDLIDIFNSFQKEYSDWTLHIIGEGSEKQTLQNKINELNLEKKVYLCGNKLSKDLEKEYLSSSIYLMTSFSESFGLVLVEAASYGLPIVAFDSAQGAKEIIENNKNGFLIPNRDKKLFVQKIIEIIENPEMKKNLSKNSLITANNFSKDKISEEWNKFIDSI